MQENRNSFLSVRLTPEQHRELRLMARAGSVNSSEIVRRAIDEKAERMTGSASNGQRGT